MDSDPLFTREPGRVPGFFCVVGVDIALYRAKVWEFS